MSKAESRIVLGQARSFGDGASDRPGRGRFEEFPLAVVMLTTSDGRNRVSNELSSGGDGGNQRARSDLVEYRKSHCAQPFSQTA